MENMEPRLKQAPFFRCESGLDWVPVCQKCETCVLAWKIFATKEWFRRVSDISQRRFLVSILGQLNSLYLLHYFQNILQTTQGKDFIYNRSRVKHSRKEGKEEKMVKSSLNQTLDETVEHKMKEILYWFSNSTHRTKANYTLLLLQMCDTNLLLTAADVIRVLFVKEWNSIAGLRQDSSDVLFYPEKNYNPVSDTSYIYWTAKLKPMSFPMSRVFRNKVGTENVEREATITEEKGKSSLQCISELNRQLSGKPSIFKLEDDPCSLLLSLDDVQVLSSGSSKYRDFIRYLPLHLSKYILRMLDKNSLSRCAFVSQHWAALTQQVKVDLSMHSFIQNQISLLQGSYTRGIDPNYASKVSVPVPKIVDEGKRTRSKSQKWKLRTKNDYNLWNAYQNQETQMVQMEERNVFCGTYNIRILSDTKDQNRIIHYNGGDLMAVSSNRKIQLLNIMQAREIPTEFRGHAGSIRALFLSEEENILFSGSYDLSIRYWDVTTGTCIRIFYGHQGTITCLDLHKNRLVSGAKDGQVKEWDIETGKCLKTFKHKDAAVLAVKISETYIVSSCEKGMVKVWHVAAAQLLKTLTGHEGAVKCLFFNQWHLISGGVDGLVMAWSMVGKYERCLMAFKHPKEVLQVSLLYLRVISACGDGKIRIYNFLNGNCLKVIKVDARGDPVLSFFYQGNRMVVQTDSNILMFQFENVKWQYTADRGKAKKSKDKEEEREEISVGDVHSKSSTQVHSLRDSVSSKQTMTQEPPLSKVQKSRVHLKSNNRLSSEASEEEKLNAPQRDVRKKVGGGLEDGLENLEAKPEAEEKMNDDMESPGEEISRPRKKFWKVPMTPDRFLLTVNALQQVHNSEFGYPHRPQTPVIDAWRPSIPYPRKVLSFKGKSVQHAVDQLRYSNFPTDVKQTNIPLEIQKLQPNLKKSLHSPRVQSTIPQPILIRSRASDSLKGDEHLTSSIDGAMRRVGPLTSMQVIKPNRMLAPRGGTTTLSLRKERPRFYTTLDPLRVNTGFMLLTVKEEKEYREAKMKQYQASKSTKVVDPGKASKAAWIRKIKGLPIDNFMKQGKTAAPELGQNVFI
ncbi:CMT1A duplicated region transcript 1 protein isoform X3 [Mesocricetus auratus]|uniref:CMT1A duplicated region transcript 1 protein isoform X3 n=1 Tax=Mesocricetus auratus TaxID=10036 RepID=A0ABM2XPZ3_MESAU|nr:CMT1A duplicated region transcript 1 protein isoform X3 [Mesocricetus auratus]